MRPLIYFQKMRDGELMCRPVRCKMFIDIRKFIEYQWRSINFNIFKNIS